MPVQFDAITGLPKTTKQKTGGGLPLLSGSTNLSAGGSLPLLGGSFTVPQLSSPAPAPQPAVSAPASVPDLTSLIGSDPLYQQTQADIAAARAADRAQRAYGVQNALVNYGGVPDLPSGLGDLGGDITDTVRQLAQANTNAGLSSKARIQQAYDDAVRATKDSLTARGLLSSGETGYQLGRRAQDYNRANSDALQALLNALYGMQSNYTSAENARLQSLANAASSAAGRIPPTTAATPDTPGSLEALTGISPAALAGAVQTAATTTPPPLPDYDPFAGINAAASGAPLLSGSFTAPTLAYSPYGNKYQRRKQAI